MDDPIGSQARYDDRTFKSIQITNSQFRSIEFHECTFLKCVFTETAFQNCRFANCLFQHCDLGLMKVPDSSFSSTHFENSILIGVDWTQANWQAASLGQPLGFEKCTLNHSTFIGLYLRKIQMKDCSANNVDFREADLSQVDFGETDFSESLFRGTNLTEADLSRARNYSINPGQNLVKQAKFSLPEAMSLLYSMEIVLVE